MTTMKKLLTIIMLFLSIGVVDAQTKEETINWLKENFKPSEGDYEKEYKIEEITPCYISVSYDSYHFPSEKFEGRFIAKLPLPVKEISIMSIKYDSMVVEVTNGNGQKRNTNSFTVILGKNAREIERKMNHLSTFCSSNKQKEDPYQRLKAMNKNQITEWVKNKLSKGLGRMFYESVVVKKVDPCKIVITYKSTVRGETYEETIPTKIDYISEGGHFVVKDNGIILTKDNGEKEKDGKSLMTLDVMTTGALSTVELRELEAGIIHLSSFCK